MELAIIIIGFGAAALEFAAAFITYRMGKRSSPEPAPEPEAPEPFVVVEPRKPNARVYWSTRKLGRPGSRWPYHD